MEPSRVWEKLSSPQKIDRDIGKQLLKREISNDISRENQIEQYNSIISKTLTEDISWEKKLALLELCGVLSNYLNEPCLYKESITKALEWLEDPEVRVRLSAGEYLGIICRKFHMLLKK